MPEKKRKNDVIQVVLAVYDPKGNYSCFAGIVMTSLFSNTESKINVTILHDETLSRENRRHFEQTAARWEQEVSFIDVSDHISRVAVDPDSAASYFTRGALFRLLLPDLMSIPKVIYLDCDIVVNLDIAELWDVPLEAEEKSLAAVRQRLVFGERRVADFYMKIREWVIGYATENYFNSGVLVMNLRCIREKYPHFVSEAFRFPDRFAVCYSRLTEYFDQDFLNVFFGGDVLYIGKRFNEQDECHEVNGAILHYLGVNKPWKKPGGNSPRDAMFWEMFAKSEFTDRLAETVAALYRDKPLSEYPAWACAKSALLRLPVVSWLSPQKISRLYSLMREILHRFGNSR